MENFKQYRVKGAYFVRIEPTPRGDEETAAEHLVVPRNCFVAKAVERAGGRTGGRGIDDDGIYNGVEFDADLQGGWTTAVDGVNATIVVTPGEPAATVTVTVPQGANGEFPVRLKVTQPRAGATALATIPS